MHCRIRYAALLTVVSPSAHAQSIPSGLLAQNKASSGSTDVAAEGFQKVERNPDEIVDTTEFSVAAGGLVAAGNSRSLAMTGSSRFRLRRAKNQLGAIAAVNYARSAPEAGAPMAPTVENFQGVTRYDRFLAHGFSVFLSTSGRRDRFQGLDLRLNVDPGVGYYVIDDEGHQLWCEGGYDLQHDVRRDEAIRAAAVGGDVVAKSETRHHARGFLGYDNSINDHVHLFTGLEYLRSLTDSKNWRLNWDIGLSSEIHGRLSAATTFSLKYDANPLPGVESADAVSAFNLVYSLL